MIMELLYGGTEVKENFVDSLHYLLKEHLMLVVNVQSPCMFLCNVWILVGKKIWCWDFIQKCVQFLLFVTRIHAGGIDTSYKTCKIMVSG